MNKKIRSAPSASNRTPHDHPKEAMSLLGWLAIVTRNGRWTPEDTLLGVRVRPESPSARIYDVKMLTRGPRVMGGPVMGGPVIPGDRIILDIDRQPSEVVVTGVKPQGP